MADETNNESGVAPNLMRPGKISYIEIPAADPGAAAAFYSAVFGWQCSGEGRISFSDTSGEIIGAFVTEAAPHGDPGIMLYISSSDIHGTAASITANGGAIVREPYPEGDLLVATYRDPAGNMAGIWQAPG